MPFVSVLLPTRNRVTYLPYAVQSVLDSCKGHNIELIISDNHSTDGTSDFLESLRDHRIRIVKPPQLLSMSDHFEYILAMANGEWITILGDDDALMPHSLNLLKLLVDRYPSVEAVASRRAYYFWPNYFEDDPRSLAQISFLPYHHLIDSKHSLRKILNNKLDYFCGPQLYTGGFQRTSLVKRIKSSQNGMYYRSVTPDAYSVLLALLHTDSFLSTDIPLAWTGSSPHLTSTKNKLSDFLSTQYHSQTRLHPSFPAQENINLWSFHLTFWEAYFSAAPLTDLSLLSSRRIRQLYLTNIVELLAQRRMADALQLYRGSSFSLNLFCLALLLSPLYKIELIARQVISKASLLAKSLCSRRGWTKSQSHQTKHILDNQYVSMPSIQDFTCLK